MAKDTVKVIVSITLNPETGEVNSSHQIHPDSVAILKTWPSGGLVHTSQALLVEAFRRECYTMALTQMSLGRSIEKITPEELDNLTLAHVLKMGTTLLRPLAEGTLGIFEEPKTTSEGTSNPVDRQSD